MSCAGHLLEYLYQQEWKRRVQTAEEKKSVSFIPSKKVADSCHHSSVGTNKRKSK